MCSKHVEDYNVIYIYCYIIKELCIKLHGYTVHQRYQTHYFPTNAHNVKHVELLKQFKIKSSLLNFKLF